MIRENRQMKQFRMLRDEIARTLGYRSFSHYTTVNYGKITGKDFEKITGLSRQVLVNHARAIGMKIRGRGGSNNPYGQKGNIQRFKEYEL